MMASQNLGNPSMENLTVEDLSNSTQIVSNDLFMNVQGKTVTIFWWEEVLLPTVRIRLYSGLATMVQRQV
jgi:hypothetical protein